MLRASVFVAADVNLVRKCFGKMLARRYVQMPVYILEYIHAGFENRIEVVGVRIRDNRTIRLRMRKIALVELDPVQHMRTEPLTYTVENFPRRECLQSFYIPGNTHVINIY